MIASLAVRLVIPDAAATTARRALHPDLPALVELQREVGWEFDIADGRDGLATVAQLARVDVFANRNKHAPRWWPGPLEAARRELPAGADRQSWGGLLVEERDDPEVPRLQHLLIARLRYTDVHIRRRGTLWWLAVAAAEPRDVARRAAHLLLANPHGQLATILEPQG